MGKNLSRSGYEISFDNLTLTTQQESDLFVGRRDSSAARAIPKEGGLTEELGVGRAGLAVIFNMCLSRFPSMVHCVFVVTAGY